MRVTLTVVTDIPLDQLTTIAEGLRGRSLPGLEGCPVWEAGVSVPTPTVPAGSATSLAPIPGLLSSAGAHPDGCECDACEEPLDD